MSPLGQTILCETYLRFSILECPQWLLISYIYNALHVYMYGLYHRQEGLPLVYPCNSMAFTIVLFGPDHSSSICYLHRYLGIWKVTKISFFREEKRSQLGQADIATIPGTSSMEHGYGGHVVPLHGFSCDSDAVLLNGQNFLFKKYLANQRAH